MYTTVCMLSQFGYVQLFATPWTVPHHAPLSMWFPRQEYWSGLPFPSPSELPDPGIKPGSPTLQADSLPSEPPGKPIPEFRPLLFKVGFLDYQQQHHLGAPDQPHLNLHFNRIPGGLSAYWSQGTTAFLHLSFLTSVEPSSYYLRLNEFFALSAVHPASRGF